MSDRKWYLWPQGYIKDFVPWFIIIRRLIFWPLLLVGMCVTFIAVWGGHGLDEAKQVWGNT